MHFGLFGPHTLVQGHRGKRRNRLHSGLLIGGMGLLVTVCAWLIAGLPGVILTLVLGATGLAVSSRASPKLVLQLFKARPLPRRELEAIHAVAATLARRAALPATPRLFYIPSPTLNAFSVGQTKASAIAVTSGLLQRLTLRELAGVLAHETSHIRNNDMWIMGLADVVSRLTRSMSFAGVLLLLINLPLTLSGAQPLPWLLVLLLVFAPAIGTLLQLALSRSREFEADLDAAELTGDPAGLAAALQKLERYQGRFWEDIILPGRRDPLPSVLRSHPQTEERVRRLMALTPSGPSLDLAGNTGLERRPTLFIDAPRRPRWRRSGYWY